jgi:predicted transcriptional regulator YheO
LGLNYDITIFEEFSNALSYLTVTTKNPITQDSELFFYGSTKEDIGIAIKHFRVSNGLSHKVLSKQDKYKILEYLIKAGHLNKRGAVPIISEALAITRPTVYKYIKDIKTKN